MKTNLSRILTLALALVLVLSMTIPAFAAGTGTPGTLQLEEGSLTVSGDQLGGKNVTVIRMFSASVVDVDNNSIISDGDTISYELESAWEAFFTDEKLSSVTGDTKSEKAYNYVSQITNKVAFAKEAKKWAKANSATLGSLTTTKPATASTNPEVKDNVVFDKLLAGYYLVYPQSGSTAANRDTDAMLVNVPSQESANLELKTVYPTVEKKVEGKDAVTSQIGETVTFTLTAKVPNMVEYDTYKFVFKDKMSKGLTFLDTTVSVKIVTKNSTGTPTEQKITTGFVVNHNVQDDGTTDVSITFENLKAVTGIDQTKEQEIVVSYTARLNENAVIGGNGNKNEAKLEYSNDPGSDGTGESTPDITKVYTFPITIEKYYSRKNADNTTTRINLKDAKFKLTTKQDGTDPIELVQEESKDGIDIYHVASQAEKDNSTVTKTTKVLTPESGKITINGLKAGIYYLHEIDAPVGYNKLDGPVKIEITANVTETPVTVTYKVDDGEANAAGDSTIPVENHTGALLPGTGSIGTVGLTILGVAVVVLAIILPDRKKKKAI